MRRISIAVAIAALSLAGCGGLEDELGGSDAGTSGNYPATCNADTDCLTGEVCHPVGLVCVKSCLDDATVCGANEECVETTADGKSVTICKCDSSTCATGEVCSTNLDDVCETACVTNADCAAFTNQTRTCNTTTGLCEFTALPCGGCPTGKVCDTRGAIEQCIDVCTATSCTEPGAAKCGTSGLCEACAVAADCANVGANYTCDATHTCVSTATTCNSANPAPGNNDGPDTCNYAEVCSSNVCVADALPDDTCATGYSWTPSQRGPVIVSVSAEPFTGSGNACNGATDRDCCANGGGGFRVDIEFYAPNGMSASGWTAKSQTIMFIDASGNEMAAGHFDDYPDANAEYSITPLHAGVCRSDGTTGSVDPTGWSVYLVDGNGATGNAACL